MQLKATTNYGIRFILYLATQEDACSSADIAHDLSIPRDYLIQFAQLLRHAGIIKANSGKYGGYCLAKDPAEISVLDILSALDTTSKKTPDCAEPEKCKNSTIVKEVTQAYRFIEKSFNDYLRGLTVDVLLGCAHDSNKGK